MKSFTFAILGAEYILGLVPRGTHSYDHFIRPSELLSAARHAGLEAAAIKGLEYNPLTKIYKLSGDSSVNYMVATIRS